MGIIHLRMSAPFEGLTAAVSQVVKDVDARLRVIRVRTLEEDIMATLGAERQMTNLLSFFGGLALMLACVGLYGVMGYTVASRTREIGIRMALGARAKEVVSMVLGDTMRLAILGVALGIPAALATTHMLRSLLFGLTPTDPATIAVATALLLAGAAMAADIPGRHPVPI